ncbi:hypothetical protein HDU93_004292, partial [Gonapodya sp. JEL0774]
MARFNVTPIYQRLFFNGVELIDNDATMQELRLPKKPLLELLTFDDKDVGFDESEDPSYRSRPEIGFKGTSLLSGVVSIIPSNEEEDDEVLRKVMEASMQDQGVVADTWEELRVETAIPNANNQPDPGPPPMVLPPHGTGAPPHSSGSLVDTDTVEEDITDSDSGPRKPIDR